MISSFFGKTKPINYIVLSVFLFLFYAVYLFFGGGQGLSLDTLPGEVLVIGILLFSMYIISRMVKVEKVTDLSSFAILFFTLLLVAFSETLGYRNAIFANFFLLLAIWRLLAIKSVRNVKHKIFDASFLICVAGFFYDWALIFLILVFVAINVYDRKPVKNWMVPFAAIITVLILSFTLLKFNDSLGFFVEHYQFKIDFLYNDFFRHPGVIKRLVYTSIMLVLMLLVFLKVRKKGGGKLILLRMVFLVFVLGSIMSFFKFDETSPVLITFFPVAVFLTNYLENIKRTKLRELVVGICVLVSFLLFILDLKL
ncbi:EpsG family protein [Flagellimonas sp. S3867]|uniref:EpsG family protein n=1 Tax=Flagellimonas sp. S3867 TaxID=2768063 RepID=UPI001684AC2C|nr:EpsG family protein [Flagellimonas sp. S3867]